MGANLWGLSKLLGWVFSGNIFLGNIFCVSQFLGVTTFREFKIVLWVNFFCVQFFLGPMNHWNIQFKEEIFFLNLNIGILKYWPMKRLKSMQSMLQLHHKTYVYKYAYIVIFTGVIFATCLGLLSVHQGPRFQGWEEIWHQARIPIKQ